MNKNRRGSLSHIRIWLTLIALLVSLGLANANIGFRRATTMDRMVDPAQFPNRYGMSFSLRDTSKADTSAAVSIDSTAAAMDSVLADTSVKDEQLQPDTLSAPPSSETSAQPTHIPATGVETSTPPTSGLSASDIAAGTSDKPGSIAPSPAKSDSAETVKPLPIRPTLIQLVDTPIESKSIYDTTTGYVIQSKKLAGVNQPFVTSMTGEQFLKYQIRSTDRETRRQAVLAKFPKTKSETGTGISIQIPVFKSAGAQRIFGGSNIGLSVAGQITVEGGLTAERKNEISRDQNSPTNYALKVNQKQQFNIKGKVGEKVTVEIDQDSEKLFEFENNLRVRYKGDDDEIIKSVEAGNVDLNLRGTTLVSSSNQHKGLFGFKTESQFGPLKLTTIASLDKGEKNEIEISGGARTGRPVTIMPTSYVQYRYYFLSYDYRENYKYYDDNLNHVVTSLAPEITYIDVYKSVTIRAGENENAVQGWAFANPSEPYRAGMQPDNQHKRANFLRLEPGVDYQVNMQLGYIRLARQIDAQTTLAVAYSTAFGNVGDLDPTDNSDSNPFILKLIQPENPQPSDTLTWNLMWRNVYDLGSTSINEENFDAKIVFRASGQTGEGNEAGVDVTGQQRSYMAIFGLDQFSIGGPGEDGKVDGKFVNFPLGELVFPDLQPFFPEGVFKVPTGGGAPIPQTILLNPAEFDSLIYNTAPSQLYQVTSDFSLQVTYAASSATYDLGFGVLEGSEEVLLNGQRLSRGNDYSLDPITGTLTILRRDALVPGADLKIRYEKGQLFQLDTKTMLGLRAEYELWQNSYIGGTLLYLNQRTLDQRVRVGGEPLRNMVWGMNANLRFPAPFLTSAVNVIPLISTDAASEIAVSGEVAQVLPDPNSLNSPSTGDFNGVAYIDDFESIKRATPLGLTRRQWSPASFPVYDSRGSGRWLRQRGRVLWYEPDPIKITDIWPERETQTQSSTMSVLKIEYQPWWTEWGAAKPESTDPERSWGGVMRYIGAGYADQTQSKYLEIWLNRGTAIGGVMYIDLGRISEDVIPDGRLNTEDRPIPGMQTGNGILDSGEDIGLDGIGGTDPADSSFVNGIDHPKLPSWDDFHYSFSNRNDYRGINGTESNGSGTFLEGGNYPDTEDLNGNNFLDQNNDFFRYRIDFSEGDLNRYIVGGLGNDKGWRLYRIPLNDTLTIGRANFTQIEFARIWFTGFQRPGAMMIAQMEIVGNEWREVQVTDLAGKVYDPVSVATVNTHDNPEYNLNLPPGVAGEVDPVTGLRTKEQALVVRVNKLGTGESGVIYKGLAQGQTLNLLEYRRLKMFVRGGGFDGRLTDRYGREVDIEMFLRMGEDTTSRRPRYYEYSQRLRPGWANENEIDIELDRLSALKFLREKDSLRDYDILPDGDVIRVVGDPSLRNIRFLSIGIKNHGQEITSMDDIEIWVNELRVSDIHRDPGWAATGSISMNAAKLLSIRADMRQQQADFHNLNQRTSSDQSDKLTGTMSATFNIGEFFDPQWGITLPLRGDFRQEVGVPKFKPNSDVRLSAMSSEKVDIWSKFSETIWDRKKFTPNPVYESPIDSMVAYRKNYTLSLNASKSRRSPNWLVAYSLDRIKLGGSYSETWSSDSRDIYSYGLQKRGNAGYDFSFDKPIELKWLGWAGNVPVINKLSESTFRPLPNSISLSGDGTETFDNRLSRTGSTRLPPTYRFNTARTYGTGWRPFTILGFDFRQTVNSTRIPEDSTRTYIATQLSRIDSTRYWVETDTGGYFDTLGYDNAKQRDIERIKNELFWKLFGYRFVDNDLNQSYSFNFNPQFVSWLGTETNYRTSYRWSWSNTYGPGDRSVSVNGSFTSNVTFRLTQFTGKWATPGGAGMVKPPPAKPGSKPDFGMRPPPKGADPAKPGSLSGDNPEFPELPPMELPQIDPWGESVQLPPNRPPAPEWDEEAFDTPPDSLRPLEPKPDTGEVGDKKRITPPNPLTLAKSLLRRMRDISWNYTLSNDTRNNSVAEGQASMKYRLGFTRDPGLATIPGYTFRNSFSTRQENRFSSGYEIRQNIVLSNLEYQIVNSRNVGQQESGSFSQTVFQYFGDDEVTIKNIPFLNYTFRWSGWEQLPYLNQLANSVSLDQSFRGSMTEQWLKAAPDSAKRTTRVEYDRNFSPLLGINFSWKIGISTTARYNLQQQVTDERTGSNVKNRSTTQTITLSGSYTARGGFKIPLYIFNSIDLKNNTTFTMSYNNNFTKRESSASGEKFSTTSETSSWSLAPSIEYTFSNAVRGGFRYAYNVQRNLLTGRTKSQEFTFNVVISIRG